MVGLASSLLFLAAPLDAETDRPNVLFIAIDDLRWELGCYGADHIISPNIDALAERGVLFERAYVAHPVCGPSRASVLTGMRPETLGAINLYTHPRDVKPDVVTLPQLFMQHGYTTQGIGKVFHANHQPDWEGDAASWSIPAALHYINHLPRLADMTDEVPPNESDVARTAIRDMPDEWHIDGIVTELALDAMNELRDEPFFLAVGYRLPHLSFDPPKRYWDMYDREALPPVASPERPEGAPDLAFHPGQELMREFPDGLTDHDIEVLRHGYYASTTFIDHQVGRLMEELDRLELADNTIIMLWSDHGFHLGEHGLWTKLSTYEFDLRVPLIIVDPDATRTAGSRAAGPVELLDMYPTLVDLCGLEPPPHELEGVSLRPMLHDPTVHVKPFAYSQTPLPHRLMPRGRVPMGMGYSMRSERLRYTEWRDWHSMEILARELYDYSEGWIEEKNLAEVPEYAGLVDSMAKSMEEVFPRRIGAEHVPTPQAND